MARIEGILTAMVTPFDERGEIDWPAVHRLARHLVDHGSDGIVVAGTTGESPTLRDPEHLALVGAVREAIGPDRPLVCGTGTNDTRHSVELTHAALGAGADAALVVAPYYNKPTRAGMLAHYEAVAGVGLPVVVYNIPSRSVVNIDAELLGELATLDAVVAVKQANDDELEPIEGLALLAGNDEALLPALERGGAGGILVASHLVGPQMAQIARHAGAGELEAARDLDGELRELYRAMGMLTNPIPVKAALAMQGLIGPAMRLPMAPPDDAEAERLREVLGRHGLLAGVPS